MTKKTLLLTLLMALFMPWAANAQTELTVCDGTTTNEKIPVNGLYVDTQGTTSEFIIPAETEGMSDMVGCAISKVTFYISSVPTSWGSPTIQLYIGEVEGTTLSSLNGPSNFTVVNTMVWSNQQSTIEVEFNEPYTYEGGNLLIGTYVQTKSSNYKGTPFYGITAASGASRYNNGSGTGTAQTFLPKTTFEYTPGGAICIKPATLVVSDVTSNGATLSWTEGSGLYNIELNGTVIEERFEGYTYNLTDLNPSTNYTVKVQSVCDDATSGWKSVSFDTPCDAITVTDSWSENFNSLTAGIPDCWDNSEGTTTDESYKWNYSSTGHDGAGLRFNSYNNSSNNTNFLKTPTLNFATGKVMQLTFWYKNPKGGDFSVYISTDGGKTYTTELATGLTNVTDWTQEEITLSDYVDAENVVFVFKGTSNYGSGDANIYLDDVVVEEAPSCLKPKNLTLATDGSTVTVTWTDAANANIDINGTVTNNVTSPYEFNAELSTTYTVKVQGNCGDALSVWTDAASITTPNCIGGHSINYTLNDSYSDGWNGASITVMEGCDVLTTLTVTAATNSGTLELCGDYVEFIWNKGNYDSECSFTFSEGGTTLFTKPSAISDGMVLYTIGTQSCAKPTGLTAGTPEAKQVELSWTSDADAWQLCVNNDENNLIDVRENPYTLTGLTAETTYTVKVRANCGDEQSCWTDAISFTTAASSCTKPTDLAETNITVNSADLSWTGTSNSYVLQYRPWNPAGDDIVTTGTMTTYTVDLSQYEGTGSVAIRHYDISDMFALIVDDIQVTNANGEVVYTQNFEACGGSMPDEFTNMDLDGDGNTWAIGENSDLNVNGTYGIISYSYDNYSGPLYPDNWLIINDIQMGGQMTFQARGQDASYAAENFAIYVSTDNSIVEVPVPETTYAATDLTPNTPYAWQVKGVCDDDESGWSSSFFKTKDDMLVFATDGNWNVVANWTDADGNAVTELPTFINNVRIDAAATIPAGELAVANKATIGTGSILIKDGGQLKQNSASLRVTMEKEIAGYGENDGYYYFIASPFNGRTLYETSGSFSHVENMLTGEYDLYAFDPTADLEWINYKSSSTHVAFQAENGLEGLLYGEGYLYANQEGTTIEFEGTAGKSNNYSETKDYTYDAASTDDFNGWALVGNFFTCNAYINYVDADGNALDADFYTLNSDNTYSLMSSNQPLAPLTGALINYSATGKVQYSTEPAGSKGRMLNMTVTEGRGKVDQARVRFGEGYNLGKMSFRNSSSLYIPQNGNDYAVVRAEASGEIPVSFKAEHNGTYTLSFSNENVEFSYLHLIDNMTGNDIDLLANPSYTFDAKTTDYASRFKLVFAEGNSDDNFAFFSNGSLVISNEGNATMNVYDVTGRLVNTQSVNGSCQVELNAPAGVYMIQLVNGDNTKTQKIVVK